MAAEAVGDEMVEAGMGLEMAKVAMMDFEMVETVENE